MFVEITREIQWINNFFKGSRAKSTQEAFVRNWTQITDSTLPASSSQAYFDLIEYSEKIIHLNTKWKEQIH